MHRERYTHPIFNDIVDNLLSLIEENYDKGRLAGIDYNSKPNQEMRDTCDAIELLTAIGSKASKGVPILIKLLKKGTHWWFPGIAAKALGSIGPPSEPAIPLLVDLLLSRPGCPKSDYGHYSAAIALGQIGSVEAVPYLIEAAKNPNPQGPGWRAILALSDLGNKAIDALPTLIELRQKEEYREHYNTIESAIKEINTKT